jgi:CRP-like cAMP-binding protein
MTTLPTPALRAAIHLSPLFFNLGPNDLDAAAMMSATRYYDKHQPVYRQGEPGLSVYLLREGQVKLVRVSSKGDESVLWMLHDGDGRTGNGNGHLPYALQPSSRPSLFGAIEPGVHSCTAIPIRAICTLQWNRDQLLLRLPHLAPRLADQTARHLRELEQRLCEMATYPVPYRVAMALLRLQTADGTVAFTREEMAQHCGTTLFTVSRCMSQWAKAGLVQTGREKSRVLDGPGLLRAVEETQQ